MKTILAALALAAAALSPSVHAQGYPSRTIRLIVPFPAGGTVDGVVRILQPELQKAFGQTIIVDNVSGAGGRIGANQAAHAEPDGYTLIMVYDSYAIDPIVYKDLPYDPWKDLLPVSLVARAPLVAVASTTLPPNDIKELVAYAKANPGKVAFGSTGVGSSNHLAGELFAQATGTQMLHVPYKGGAPAQVDLLGGSLQLFWGTPLFAKTLVPTGKVKILGQAASTRSPSLPSVKTLGEQGFQSIEVYAWMGLLVPKGTPPEIIARWQAELVKAAKVPSVAAKLGDLGFDVVTSTPEEFKAFIEHENAKWQKVIESAHISLQ